MPSRQEITVGLRFTADASQARAQLASLKNDLIQLGQFQGINLNKGITDELIKGSQAANQLRAQLEAATNVKTGALDLTKFTKQLKNGGTSLSQYKNLLSGMGIEGQKAFLSLTTSIQSAEIPLLRINKLFVGLWDNLKRTAGWQISSTAIHAFMGAIQGAYHYAQDLNESLNNIRIVTGKSIDEMKDFAEQANKAAKALSTTTKAYTDASLIFYQQGLDGKDVEDRTNVVIKMANVTGQSASEVSDQMTAVWNNFAKGGENLESFADKMTALGAATASSTDEIAGGLEKFAAVADTVGLSFDYAATALATITAITRQSEDTVGTALKTIFARLEGLKLGETLEDGTELNKYSGALAAVGVNIKDANGQLKAMDDILDELGEKWGKLSKDTQMAVAQTVAGTRQYNQLIALMDNWGTFQKNLSVSQSSAGTLQKQANIYAESWDAAQKRVKASMESIYTDLMNDEFFIDATNNIAKIIDTINGLIKSMGGLPGLLTVVSTLIFTFANSRIEESIRNIGFDIGNFISKGKLAEKTFEESILLGKEAARSLAIDKETGDVMAQSYERMTKARQALNQAAAHMPEVELETAKIAFKELSALEEQLITLQEKNVTLEETYQVESLEHQDNLKYLAEEQTQIKETNRLKKQALLEEEREQNKKKQRSVNGSLGANSQKLSKLEDSLGLTKLSKKKRQEAEENLQTTKDRLVRKSKTKQGLSDEEKSQLSTVKEYLQVKKDIVEKQKESVDLSNRNKEIDKELNQLAEEKKFLEEATENILKHENEILELEKKHESLQNAAQIATEYNRTLTNTNISIEDQKKKREQIIELLRNQKLSEQKIDEIIGDGTKKVTYFQEEVSKVNTEMAALKLKITKILEQLGFGAKEIDNILEEFETKARVPYKELLKNGRNLENQHKLITKANAEYLKTLNQGKGLITDYATLITQGAQALSRFSMGISGIVNITRTLKDDDLTIWQKFSTLLMSLPMAISGISAGFSAFNNIRKTTNYLMTQAQLLQTAETSEAFKKLNLTEKQFVIDALRTKQYKGLQEEEIKEMLIKDTSLKLEHKDLIAKILSTTGLKAKTAATWELIKAELAEIGLNPVMIGSILAVVAAIGVLIGVIALLVKAYNKEADALKEANEQLRQANEDAEQIKSTYEDLKTTIDELNEANKVFEDLDQNTTAWGEAVTEVNEKMLKLIGLYPELAKFMYVDKEGRYTFSEEGQDRLKALQEEKLVAVQNSQANQLVAQQAVSSMSFEKNATDTARSITNFDNKVISSLIFGTVGAMLAPTAAMNGYAGGVWGALNAVAESEKVESELKKLSKAIANDFNLSETDKAALLSGGKDQYGKNLSDYAEKLGLHTDALVNGLKDTNSEVSNAIRSLEKNEEATRSLAKLINVQIATSAIKNKYDERITEIANRVNSNGESRNLGDRYNALIEQTLGTMFSGEAEAAFEKELNKYGSFWTSLTGGYGSKLSNSELSSYLGETISNDKDLMETYLIKSGLASEEQVKNNGIYTSGTNEGTLKIEGIGEWQRDDDYMRQALYRIAAMEKAISQVNANVSENLITSLVDIADRADSVGQQYGADFASAILKSLNEDQVDLSTVFTELDPDELNQFKNMSDADILKMFNIDDSVAKNGASAWIKAFREELETYDPSVYFEAQLAKITTMANDAGLEATDITDYATYLAETADKLGVFSNNLKNNIEDAGLVAVAIGKMDKGIQQLSDDLSDAITGLRDNAKGSLAYSKALATLKEDVGTMLNISKKYVTEDFIVQHLGDIKKAAEADSEAIDKLQMLLAREMVVQIATELDLDVADTDKLTSAVETLAKKIPSLAVGVDINLNDTQFHSAVADILNTAGMTTEKAREIFAGMSLDVDFESEWVPVSEMRTPTITEEKVYENIESGKDEYGKWKKRRVEQTVTSGQPLPVTSYIEVPNININGKKGQVKINKATKVSSGAVASKPTTKGSSGSKSSKKDKTLSDEQERYHEINKTLESISTQMDRFSKAKDKAFGGRHIAAIRAERKELDNYLEALKQKEKEIRDYLSKDLAKVEVLGGVIDERGNISNFNDVIANLFQQLQDQVIDEDTYNERKKLLTQYEETWKELNDNLDEQYDIAIEKLNSKFEEIDYVIEVRVELSEASLKLIEFQLKNLEDKEFANSERLALYTQQANIGSENFDAYKNAIRSTLEAVNASPEQIDAFLAGDAAAIANLTDLNADALKRIQDNLDKMLSEYDKVLEAYKALGNELVDLWDKYDKKFEQVKKNLEFGIEELNHYQNLIDLIGRDTLGISAKTMAQLRQIQIKGIEGQQEVLKQELAMNQTNLNKAEQALAEARKRGSDIDIAYWKEMVERGQESVQNLQKELWESEEEWVKMVTDDWEKQVKEMLEDFEKEISGIYKTLDKLSEALDQRKKIASNYLPEYQQFYELNKLNRELNKQIDNSTNVRSQQKLRDFQKELLDLQASGVKMSEYDLQNLQKRYDLKLAELALEESQNAKSQVRLVKDSKGNYSYVYTANEDKLNENIGKYEDALYALQELNSQYIDTTQSQLVSLTQEMVQALTNATTNEERQRITEYYAKQLEYITNEFNKALDNNKILIAEESDLYKNLTGNITGLIGDVATSWEDTIIGQVMGDGYSSMEDWVNNILTLIGDGDNEGLVAQINILHDNLEDSLKDHYGNIEEMLINPETGVLSQISTGIDSIIDEATTLSTTGVNAFQTLADGIKEIWTSQLGPMLAEMETQLNNLLQGYQELAQHQYDEVTNGNIPTDVGVPEVGTPIGDALTKRQFSDLIDADKTGNKKDLEPTSATWDKDAVDSNRNTGSTVAIYYKPKIGVGNVPDEWQHWKIVGNIELQKYLKNDYSYNSGTLEYHEWRRLTTLDTSVGHWTTPQKRCQKCGVTTFGLERPGQLSADQINSYNQLPMFNEDEFKKYGQGIGSKETVSKLIPLSNAAKYGFVSFDSGGYTGEFGTYGKMAILHEKELILNKEDTANILSTVDLVRNLANVIDLSANNMKYNQLSLMANSAITPTIVSDSSGLQQNISIQADFPNVNSSFEIEQAFDNLFLQASQYANKKY